MNHLKLPDQILIQGLRQNLHRIDLTSDPLRPTSVSFEELKIKYCTPEDVLGIPSPENLINRVILSFKPETRRYAVTLKLNNNPEIQRDGLDLVPTFEAAVAAFERFVV